MRQILEGVQYMHRKQIIHLDLKPENIVCVNGTGTLIKIIDFGLACKLGEFLNKCIYSCISSGAKLDLEGKLKLQSALFHNILFSTKEEKHLIQSKLLFLHN